MVRDLVIVTLLGLGAYSLYVLRAVTAPALLGVLLTNIFKPVVDGGETRWGIPRFITSMACVLAMVGLATLAVAYAGPQLVAAVDSFVDDFPHYVAVITSTLGLPPDQLPQAADLSFGQMFDGANQLLGVAGNVLSLTAYAMFAGLFTLLLFVYFSSHSKALQKIKRYLPRSRREQLWTLLSKFQRAFGGFLRGQLLVACFTTFGFAVGFTLIGVPHPLVPACIGGLLSFIPNGQGSGWVVAILLLALDSTGSSHLSWVEVALYPTIVYAITQSLETFVVTPLVQGAYTRLHPLAVLGALLAGAMTGGLFGVLIAIPLTACARILLRDVVAPWLESAAERA